MSYGEKVLSRLLTPGMLVLVVGAVLVYGSGFLADRIAPAKKELVNVIVKVVGCLLALLGLLMVMEFI